MEITVAERKEEAKKRLPMSPERRKEADELDRKARGAGPGFNEQREPKEVTVDNPYALVTEKGKEPEPKRQDVGANVRETPIELMHSRGQITDDEKYAADTFRRHCEATRIGGRVSDPSRPPAKRGVSDPLMAMRLDSARALRAAHAIIGQIDYWLLYEACTVGRSVGDLVVEVYAAEKGTKAFEKEVRHIGKRIKEALELLVARGWCAPVSSRSKNAPAKPSRFYRSFGALSTDILPDEGE